MRNAWIVALNVVKDTARKRIFYVVFIFGLVAVGISPLLPTFDLGIRTQFLKDISISLTSLFGVVMAVVLSVNQVPGEVKRRTVYSILSKPVSRIEYLAGKYLGICLDLAIILVVMGLETVVLIYVKTRVFVPGIYQGVLAVFLECAVVAAFCLFLSTVASVPVNVFAAIIFYMICHVKTGFLHEKLVEGVAGVARIFTWAFYYLIPNLENFNLSQQVGYGEGVSALYLLRVLGYALLFACLFFVAGYLLFRRKDL